jgi:hypothetical protein
VDFYRPPAWPLDRIGRASLAGKMPAIVDVHLDRESAALRALVKGGNLARLLHLHKGMPVETR